MKKVRWKACAIMPAVAMCGMTGIASAAELRIQTHYASESPAGELVAQFVDDVETMSGGELAIQMHYSSEVVAASQTFGATTQGILDCDMTGPTNNAGKNSAFQFVGDIMGGYETPYQMLSWLDHGSGRELTQKLYDEYDMQFVGWWLQGHESLVSVASLAGVDDLDAWKFRSPPGLESSIFASFGARPVVMDFGEVPTALETGVIDGADASTLSTNVSLGLFDRAKYATFPGFHAMPTEHLACRKDAWNELPEAMQRMMEVALKKLALDLAVTAEVLDSQALVELTDAGVTIQDWSAEDRQKFRELPGPAGWTMRQAMTSPSRSSKRIPTTCANSASSSEPTAQLRLEAWLSRVGPTAPL